MPNTMMAADSNHPVDAAMLNAFYHEDREGEKSLWKHVIQSGIAWAAGYALLWCSKWFIAVRNHSFIHLWFTWRVWMSTLWVLMLFLYYAPKNSEQ